MNILIFSYYLYPGSAAGGMRAHMLAEGLAKRGHVVHVVTAEQEAVAGLAYSRLAVRDPFTATRLDKLLHIPDVRRRWVDAALSFAAVRGVFNSADALITSGGPFSTHLVGLHARGWGWNGAWIAEYRDLWTNSPYYALGPLRRAVDGRLERRVLTAADSVVTATETMAQRVREVRHDGVTAVYSAVMAPPDAPDWQDGRVVRCGGCLRIAHAGYLYKGRRDVMPLLRAIAAMKQRGEIGTGDLEVHFFGQGDRNLREAIERLSLEDCVITHGEIPRDQLWRELSGMDVLAVIRWQSPADVPFIPGKLFEYVAFGVPILLVNAVAGGEAENLVSELGCGVACSTDAEIEQVLGGLMLEKRRAGRLRCPDTEDLGRFSHEHFIAAYEGVVATAIASRTA